MAFGYVCDQDRVGNAVVRPEPRRRNLVVLRQSDRLYWDGARIIYEPDPQYRGKCVDFASFHRLANGVDIFANGSGTEIVDRVLHDPRTDDLLVMGMWFERPSFYGPIREQFGGCMLGDKYILARVPREHIRDAVPAVDHEHVLSRPLPGEFYASILYAANASRRHPDRKKLEALVRRIKREELTA